MALRSMTGFATVSGQVDGVGWAWEIRSVNGRGLDVRLRLPEGGERLEPVIRAAVPIKLVRGNVSLNLKLSRMGDDGTPVLNFENLTAVISAAAQARTIAEANGMELRPASVAELLTQKWVWDTGPTMNQDWVEAAKAQIPDVVEMLVNARKAEGVALLSILTTQLNTADNLSKSARVLAVARNARAGGALRTKVLAVLEITDLVDEDRLAQELAVLAVKADVTEELDRLDAHIIAARGLLAVSGPIGRKFDFLMQEFNREANTLCSKSNDTDLTAIGLEFKVVIDQMREQVQNLE
ncbi:YicC family protein [Rhodobacterales bacterium 52_120_T64]|nr:YicC family protein [Rhodobacterales bacterium 52_120_T64]